MDAAAFRIALLSATLVAAQSGASASGEAASAPSFRHDVMAVLSKAGCNSGACHGNQNGKNGFKLSLRGEDPSADLSALTREVFGRRIDRFQPDNSLVLLKATRTVAHEGGTRFHPDSELYKILIDWIGSGAGDDAPASLTALEVDPAERYLQPGERSFDLRVTARFADSTSRDVTGLAVYEPSSPLLAVSPEGRITTAGPGEGVVLVRYLNQQVPVRVFCLHETPDFHWDPQPALNRVDEYVFSKLEKLHIHPSDTAADSVFLRRVWLDLAGFLPNSETVRSFTADTDPQKYAAAVDEMLERPEFANFWALKWCDLLRVEEKALDRKGVQAFHRWIRDAIQRGMPLDDFAAEILSARGSTYATPAANFYRSHRTPVQRAESVAQVFLGRRLQCAQCHNHPFDRWTQDDYHDWTSVFGGVRYKVLENRRRDENDGHEFIGEQVVWLAPGGDVQHPVRQRPAPARLLGESASLPEDADRLASLARWIISSGQREFARVQANRIWYHLMGRGIVHPVDDFRDTNPPSHPELLEFLTDELIASEFDLRHIIRLICLSRTYRLESEPLPTNLDDAINFSHVIPRRLDAEQLLDSLSAALDVPLDFAGYPSGMRAGQIPGVKAARRRGPEPEAGDHFLEVFGKPPRLLSSEEERSCNPTISQVFHLVSGDLLHDMLAAPGNRIDALLEGETTDSEIVDQLYMDTLSRPPNSVEHAAMTEHLGQSGDRRAALEDIGWALVNSKEFLMRH